MARQVVLMLGTAKGAFLLRSSRARKKWSLEGPIQAGVSIEYVQADRRTTTPTLYAAETSFWYGPRLHRSRDLGRTWEVVPGSPRYPGQPEKRTPGEKTEGPSVERIWCVEPGPAAEPDTLYAGVDPGALFVSHDSGESWQEARSLQEHPTRKQWQPGFGGLCLHTIVVNEQRPGRLLIAISAGGVYLSEDGGKSWELRSTGVRAEFLPDPYPEAGQCVHKIVVHPERPDTIFLQNHGGVYRSDDLGRTWKTIEEGLPAVFGFPILAHPTEPRTVYIVPLIADAQRLTPGGRCTVYRSRDAGATWEALTKGLPDDAYLTVLRQALCTDGMDPAGVYFGTRTGQLFGSRDDGDTWSLIHDYLPPIFSVRAVVA